MFPKKIRLFIILLSISFLFGGKENSSTLNNTSISGNWFLNYNINKTDDKNMYGLKRGYFTVKTKINDIFSTRYTQDITLDKEGSDAGNVEMRLKYLYIKTKIKNVEWLKDGYFEFGLVHRPWLGFDSKINQYRLQGKMFLDKHKIINSADFGITYVGLIGGKINKKYQKNVSKNSPGKYGSYSLGVYNGGGYHAVEHNNNKTLEGRLTLRPLHQMLPGFQISYAFATGKNNLVDSTDSDFQMNLLYASYETANFTFTSQYYFGKGDYEETYIDGSFNSLKNHGFSFFTEIMIPNTKFALMSRYDDFVSKNADTHHRTVFIGGIVYKFLGNKVLLDYSRDDLNDTLNENIELVLEITF